MNNTLLIPCNDLVRRLVGKRIRVVLSDFDGYGVVESVDEGEALVCLE